MASSFSGHRISVVVVAVAIAMQFISVAAAAPETVYMDTVCQRIHEKSYCMKTFSQFPPASANSLFSLAAVAIENGKAHAEKVMAFADEAAKKDPSKKAVFEECHKAYAAVAASFRSAVVGLRTHPDSANYDVMVSRDQTRRVTELIGKNADAASKTLVTMNDQMDKLIDLASRATDAVDDDNENTYLRS